MINFSIQNRAPLTMIFLRLNARKVGENVVLKRLYLREGQSFPFFGSEPSGNMQFSVQKAKCSSCHFDSILSPQYVCGYCKTQQGDTKETAKRGTHLRCSTEARPRRRSHRKRCSFVLARWLNFCQQRGLQKSSKLSAYTTS